MRVALYLRTSTDEQEYTRQKEELIKLCSERQDKIYEIFEEKMSGLIDDREEFQKLISLTKKDIDAVYVWELSRLGRNAITIQQVVRDFNQKGITIYCKKEGLWTLENGIENPMTKMIIALLASMAENEIQTIKDRTISGKKHRLANGEASHTVRAPYGYRKKDGRIVVEPSEALIVQRVFHRLLTHSAYEVAREFNLNHSTITRMTKNTCYYGEGHNSFVPNMVIECPAIIDKELFDQVRAALVSRRHRGTYGTPVFSSPLRLKGICPICGYKLSPRQEKGGMSWGCHQPCNKTQVYDTLWMEAAQETLRYHFSKQTVGEDYDRKIREIVRIQTMEQVRHNKLKKEVEAQERKVRALIDAGFTTDDLKKEISTLNRVRKQMEEAGVNKHRAVWEKAVMEGKRDRVVPQDTVTDMMMQERLTSTTVYSRLSKAVTVLKFTVDGTSDYWVICRRKGKKDSKIVKIVEGSDWTYDMGDPYVLKDQSGVELNPNELIDK